MRAWLPLMAALGAAACAPQVPDSGAGVGFGDYGSYQSQQQRDAALASSQRSTPPASQPVVPSASGAPSGPAADGAPTAAEIDAALGRTSSPAPQSGPAAVQAAAAPPAPVRSLGSRRISDENDFQAVSERETIESDAERLARQRAQYEQVPVRALPDRPQDTGPNVAEYALSTTNVPGEPIYRRGFTSQRKYDRACGGQTSATEAQRAFLAAGGPQKDRLGMDPDGDGFACGWDPRPFRAARG